MRHVCSGQCGLCHYPMPAQARDSRSKTSPSPAVVRMQSYPTSISTPQGPLLPLLRAAEALFEYCWGSQLTMEAACCLPRWGSSFLDGMRWGMEEAAGKWEQEACSEAED